MDTPPLKTIDVPLKRELIKSIIIVFILLLLPLLLKFSPLGDWLKTEVIAKASSSLTEHWLNITLAFILVGSVVIGFGFSRLAWSTLGGMLFGPLWGITLSLLTTVLGSMLTFCLARKVSPERIKGLLGEKLNKFDRLLTSHSFLTALLIRLCPVGNNYITNLAAGFFSIQWWPFWLGSALGFAPQTIIFVLIGNGFRTQKAFSFFLSAILFLITSLLFLLIYYRYNLSKK